MSLELRRQKKYTRGKNKVLQKKKEERKGNKKKSTSWKRRAVQKEIRKKTRPDTRLPQSRAAGQGLFLKSPYHLGRSSGAKDRKKPKKVKCDGRTDGRD